LRHALCRLSLYLIAAAAILAACGTRPAVALPIVGNAQTVVRDVKGKLENELRTLVVDSDVFVDEEVSTGANSGTRIVFKDGTNLELGENSRLKLTKLVFDPDPNKSQIAVKALIGVFRWTSGSLPSGNYHISTPVATIGIRGTSLEFTVAESGLTTVALARGSVTVTDTRGNSVTLAPNEATTVAPPDPDGSQLAPSAPGPVPASILQTVWKMTAAINLFDAPSVSDPHSGGPSTALQTGGYDQQQNPVFFRPPRSTVPISSTPGGSGGGTSGSNGGTGTGGGTGGSSSGTGEPGGGTGNAATGDPGPPPNQTGTGQPFPNGGTTPSPTPTPIPTPTPTPTPTPATQHIAVNFGTVLLADESTHTQYVALTLPNGSAWTIASFKLIFGDPGIFGKVSGFNIGDAGTTLAGLLSFILPPGTPIGATFNGQFLITDTANDTWYLDLSAAAVPEPATLAIFILGLGSLVWAHRRRRLARAIA
jgi:hypothetical protein